MARREELHLDSNGDLSQTFRDRLRRATPPGEHHAEWQLAARVAALEDGLAVAQAAIAHLKGLAETATAAAAAANAARHSQLPMSNAAGSCFPRELMTVYPLPLIVRLTRSAPAAAQRAR